jgi:TonB family protein
MRKLELSSAVLVLLATAFLAGVHAQVPQLNVNSVKDHVGQVAAVCGHVTGYGCTVDEGTSLFFATNRNGASKTFRLRIPYANRDTFGRNPEDRYLDRLVCGLGMIRNRTDGHEIIVSEEQAIVALPDRPEQPPFQPDIHRPCDPGVELPKLRKDVKPQYTIDAMQRRVEGAVGMQAVVELDGKVRRLRIYHSLDDDLDRVATAALAKWEFTPGTFQGTPVPVVVTIEMTFALRN